MIRPEKDMEKRWTNKVKNLMSIDDDKPIMDQKKIKKWQIRKQVKRRRYTVELQKKYRFPNKVTKLVNLLR